jgi:hypothetical protein
MSRIIAAMLLAIVPALTPAQVNPLASPECLAARAELERALNDADGQKGASAERLARARAQTAAMCLGHSSGTRERFGAPEPPRVVTPPRITDGGAPALPKLESAPPPLAIQRPTVITTCDASGCWDSEGRRLNNAGAVLMGPRGLCTGTGNIVNCP